MGYCKNNLRHKISERADEKEQNAGVFADVNAGVKLSKTQMKIIYLIQKKSQISQVEIAQKLKINTSTVFRNINELKTKGASKE